jgi:Flp pilus assembly protein TadG
MFLMSWIPSSRLCRLAGRLAARLRPSLAWIGALARDRRGVSAVEFGLAAPVFLAALSPVIDLGLAFSQQIRVNQAVEAGAAYAAVNPYNSGTSWSSGVSSAITNATTLTVSPTVGSQTCGCPNATNTAISNVGTPPCGQTCTTDGTTAGYYITISATATYTSVMPYPIINNPTLSSQAVVRIQ